MTRDKVILHLVTGPRELSISKSIDNVLSVQIIKLPETAAHTVFIFGKKAVSIVGVHSTGVKYFGEKAFDHPINAVKLVSQTSVGTNSTTGHDEVVDFILGGYENATFDFMKITCKHMGFGVDNMTFDFKVRHIF